MAKKLVLTSKEDVRQAIRRRGAAIAAAMSDEEFFLSEEFKRYATQLVDFILRNHKLYSMTIAYEPNNDNFTAYTDGKNIAVNAGNVQARNAKLLERRFKVVMGSVFHETAHKLFLDFGTYNRAISKIEGGDLYGIFPTHGDPALEAAKDELEAVVKSGYGSAMASIYATLHNFVADGHDEKLMKKVFKGFIKECIEVKNEEQIAITPSLNEFIDQRTDDYGILSALCLEYSKYGFYIVAEHNDATQKYTDFMMDLEATLDAAMEEDTVKNRWNYLNLLVLQLWPFLRDKFPEQQPQDQQSQGQSQSQQSQGQGQGQGQSQGQQSQSQSQGQNQQSQSQNQQSPVPEQVQQQLQQLAQQIEQMLGNAPAPVNCSGKGVDAASLNTSNVDPGKDSDASQIALQIAGSKAESEVQKELDEAQMEAIRNANVPLIHKNIEVDVNRHKQKNKARYNSIFKEISPIARNLISAMSTMLRDRREASVQYHKRCGPIIVATDAYRPDNAFFAKKKPGENIPNMAIVFLMDESASMHGQKMDCSIKTAILLEEVASKLDIPIMIAGHNASWDNSVELNIYTDFISTKPEEDRYSLAAIESSGCNRDGLPIRKCCELLAARPENVKLLIVSSDGAPNNTGYKGEAAREDIRKTVQEFRRKGLVIYGAAIDKDKKIIEEIYGKGFLSIQNLQHFPKTLVRLIQQQLLD